MSVFLRAFRFWSGPLAFAFYSLYSAPAQAVELLVLPKSGVQDISAAVADTVASLLKIMKEKYPEVRVVSAPVFGAGERQALIELGDSAMAHAVRIDVPSLEAVQTLKAWIEQSRAPVTIEQNAIPLKINQVSDAVAPHPPSAEPLIKEQWALHNDGRPIPLTLDDWTNIPLPAVAGEDVGLLRAPLEKAADPDPSKRIIVAVLDTGVDSNHPDLREQVYRKPAECEAQEKYSACLKAAKDESSAIKACDDQWAAFDSDGNGYPRDCVGWNVTAGVNKLTGVRGDEKTEDTRGHGTHVSGIIAARADGRGIRGITQNVAILPVKVITSAPNSPIQPQGLDPFHLLTQDDPLPGPKESQLKWAVGFVDVIARGVLYSVRSGARVLNLSLAWPGAIESPFMRRIIDLATQHGALIVSAAGNDGTNDRIYPCAYDAVICVGATGAGGALTYFSNFGPMVDVAAPGHRILSTWPMERTPQIYTDRNGYEFKNGTSMAAPYVAGALARLLDQGLSTQEARVRLFAGARPIRDPAPIEVSERAFRFTSSGNLDLARSLTAPARPWIVRATKETKKLKWDRKQTEIPLELTLKNLWADAPAGATAELRVSEGAYDGAVPRFESGALRLSTDRWQLDAWPSQGVQKLSTNVLLPESAQRLRQLDGWLAFELKIRWPGPVQAVEQVLRFEVEIVTAVPGASGVREIPILGWDPKVSGWKPPGGPNAPTGPVKIGSTALPPNIRTVKGWPSNGDPDYIVQSFPSPSIEAPDPRVRFELLSPKRAQADAAAPAKVIAYEKSAESLGSMITGDLLDLLKLEGARARYVFIFRKPPPEGKKIPVFHFDFRREDLSPAEPASLENDGTVSAVPDRFQWIRSGQDLWPAWVGWGTTPPAEKPKYDPWNPDPLDPMDIRFYVLGPSGLRSVAAPEDYYFVDMLTPTAQEMRSGVVPVLLGKGTGHFIEYAFARVTEDQVADVRPFELEEYQSFLGLLNIIPTIGLQDAQKIGTTFAAPSVLGSLRATSLQRDSEPVARSSSLPPLSRTDSVMRVIGAFDDGSSFTETHHDFQFHAPTGQTLRTTLRRYSFLPAYLFSRTFFPVRVEHSVKSGERFLPGVLIPESLSGHTMEVIVPRQSESGQWTHLSRPAWLRFAADASCESIGNWAEDAASGLAESVFFCGNRFLRAPLQQ